MPRVVVDRSARKALTEGSGLRAGAATADITPVLGVSGAGYGIWGKTLEALWGRLFAHALVLEDATHERVALVGVDLHSAPRYLCERIAQRTSASCGITVDRLVLGVTHTHLGPSGMFADKFYDKQAGAEKGFYDTVAQRLAARISAAIEAAAGDLHAARVGHGTARLWGYARNRSFGAFRANDDGRADARAFAAALAGSESVPDLGARLLAIDPRVQVTWAEQHDGTPIGAFATVASHNTGMLPMRSVMSSDWMGWAVREAQDALFSDAAFWTRDGRTTPVEERTRTPLALVSGCQGDVNPSLPSGSTPYASRRDGSLTRLVGDRYAETLVEACRRARAATTDVLSLQVRYDELDARAELERDPKVGSPTLAGSEGLRSAYDHPDELENRQDQLMRRLSVFVRNRFPEPQPADRMHHERPHWPKQRLPEDLDFGVVPTELIGVRNTLVRRLQGQANRVFPLRVVSVGTHHWFTVPGEPTAWLGVELERAVVGERGGTAGIVGLTGDYIGYFTTTAEYDTQHYEGSSTLWGRGTGDWLRSKLVGLAAAAPTPAVDGGEVVFRTIRRAHTRTYKGTEVALSPTLGQRGTTLRGSFRLPASVVLRADEGAFVRIQVRGDPEWVDATWHGAPIDDRQRPFHVARSVDDNVATWTWSYDLPADLAAELDGEEVCARLVPRVLEERLHGSWPALTFRAPSSPAADSLPPGPAPPVEVPDAIDGLDPNHFIDAVDGAFVQTSSAQLATALREARDADHIVVHMHGGLVSRESIVETASEGLQAAYAGAGAYPLFLVWNSDLLTTFEANWKEIAADLLFKRLLVRLVRFVGKKLKSGVSRAAGGEVIDVPDDAITHLDFPDYFDDLVAPTAPPQHLANDEGDLEAYLAQDTTLVAHFEAVVALSTDDEDRARGIGADLEAAQKTARLISSEQLQRALDQTRDEPPSRGLGLGALVKLVFPVFKRVISRILRRRHHGVYCTIVEEILHGVFVGVIGGSVWDTMKRDSRDFFTVEPPHGPGKQLVAELEAWSRAGSNRRLSLVGHSTGAVMICTLLERLANVDLRCEVRVAFLAPACTWQLLANTLDLHHQLVSKWAIYALTDDAERGYWEVPVLYPRSLLYAVSGLFERGHDDHDMPLVGMQRFWPDTGGVGYPRPRLSEVEERQRQRALQHLGVPELRWTPDGGSDADEHGEFDDDPTTQATLAAFLAR